MASPPNVVGVPGAGTSEEYSLNAYLSQMEPDQNAALSRVLAWAPDFATGRDAES